MQQLIRLMPRAILVVLAVGAARLYAVLDYAMILLLVATTDCAILNKPESRIRGRFSTL